MQGYQDLAFGELYKEDGLCVMARGCGIDQLLSKFVQYYSYGIPEQPLSQEENKKLVFIINLNSYTNQEQLVLDHLLSVGIPPHRLPKIVTSDKYATTAERAELFVRGGCFIITSRMLIAGRFEFQRSYYSILLVVSCLMQCGALDCAGVLQSYSIISQASHMTIILISTLKHTPQYLSHRRSAGEKSQRREHFRNRRSKCSQSIRAKYRGIYSTCV